MTVTKDKKAAYIAKRGKEALSGLLNDFPEMRGRVILIDGCNEPDAEKRKDFIDRYLKTSAQLTGHIDFFQKRIAALQEKVDNQPEMLNRYKALSWHPDGALSRHAIVAPEPDQVSNAARMHKWLDERNYKSMHNKKGQYDLSHIDVHIDRVIDHEFAHTVMRAVGEKLSVHQHEMVADAFSAMRHKKKYGNDTPMVQEMADQRAGALLRGDSLHYTSEILDQVELQSRQVDFRTMTSKQMLETALQMTKEATPVSAAEHDEMAKSYPEIGKKSLATQKNEILSDMANLRSKTQSKFIKRSVARIMDTIARRSSHAPKIVKKIYQQNEKMKNL